MVTLSPLLVAKVALIGILEPKFSFIPTPCSTSGCSRLSWALT